MAAYLPDLSRGRPLHDGTPRMRAIVLAGGQGRRMRRVVRRYVGREVPKQYCSFGLGQTLLQATVMRTTRLVPSGDVIVVVNEDWKEEADAQLRGFLGIEVLSQPADRGTGTGLLWPLLEVIAADPSAMVMVTPADHGIRDEKAYWRGILAAHDGVAEGAGIVLLGSPADAPRTDYGWIVTGPRTGSRLQTVLGFVEKPPRATALHLLRKGALWNTMVLVARASALHALFRSVRPRDVAILQAVGRGEDRRGDLRRAYEGMATADFSRDVLMHAKGLSVVCWSRGVGWSDLGTPQRMAAFLGRTQERPAGGGMARDATLLSRSAD